VNLGKEVNLDGDVVVIGGGNVAIDVARTAVRLNEHQVGLYCLENREEMPALDEEVHEAIEEGILINNSWSPRKLLTENNQVVGVEFVRCVSVFDENGRFSPTLNEEETKIVPCKHVLIAIGQTIEWGNILESSKVETNRNGSAVVDTFTLQSDESDIFIGGDAATGPRFAIDAIALGKEGAISIHRYVHNGQSLVIGRDRKDYKAFDKTSLVIESYDQTNRQRVKTVDGKIATQTFSDLRGTFTLEQVQKETERCLGCGATSVDEYICVGCGACTTKCKFDAISLKRVHDENTVEFKDLKKTVLKNVVKRQGKILVHRIGKAINPR
jgi:NADPH-dependent glutamate synthase beta subunit-like oxidoreductase